MQLFTNLWTTSHKLARWLQMIDNILIKISCRNNCLQIYICKIVIYDINGKWSTCWLCTSASGYEAQEQQYLNSTAQQQYLNTLITFSFNSALIFSSDTSGECWMEMTMVCTRSGIIRPLSSLYSTVTFNWTNSQIEGYNLMVNLRFI